MSGQRAAENVDLFFEPGFFSIVPPRLAKNHWIDGDRVRFHLGFAEKMGGWEYVPLLQGAVTPAQYIGTARAVHDWSSLDTQQWIAIATNKKLYLVNNGRLYDITPLRKTSNVTNVITTTNASNIVTITDTDHRADVGDYVTIVGASAVGGITIDGSYEIKSIPVGGNSFTIQHSVAASSGATGGGSFSIQYDISAGLDSNGELLGYGTGAYGAETYGTPRTAGTGITARLRTWSLENWGEDLVASYTDGEIFHWDRTSGPNSRARLIQNAPKSVQRILVNPENRHLIALGGQLNNTESDPMRVRWCSQEDFDTWNVDPDDTSNTAGSKRLDYGSRLITAIKTRKANYIWSDTQMYVMQFVGPNDIFGFDPVGTCKIVGPNAAIDANGVVYFMAHDNFYLYDGVLQQLPSAVWNVLFKDAATRIDREQLEKVHASTYLSKNEVKWLYASEAGTGECDRYVIYNYALQCWYYGTESRTAYRDISEAISGNVKDPYGVNGGYLYRHEVGMDQVEASGTTAQAWYLRSADLSRGGSDRFQLLNKLTPEWQRLNGNITITGYSKQKPNQAAYTAKGPYTHADTDDEYDLRVRGPQISIKLAGNVLTQDMRLGNFQALVTMYGQRG